MRLGVRFSVLLLATASGCSVGGVIEGVVGSSDPVLPLPEQEPPDTQNLPNEAQVGPRCSPSAGRVRWLEEGELLVAKVVCLSGMELDGKTISLQSLPRGATWDAAKEELRWVPALDQAGVYHIGIANTNGEGSTFKVGVADRFDHPANLPIALPAAYSEEMGLPVFHLTLDTGINSQDYTSAALVYRGHAYRVDAKLRGNSSINYPKKSFTLEFSKADLFNEPNAAEGFLKKRRITMRAMFDDNSYLRDRLSYEVWNRLGSGKIYVQTYSAVAYVNGAYAGLYTVVDHIDKYLMQQNGLNIDANIFKSIGPDANFYPHPSPWDVYEKTSGTPADGQPGSFDDLIALMSFINTSDDETFRAEIGKRVDLRDYRAWLILSTLAQAQDTLGKNAFHYHDTAVGPWRVVPWDWNYAWGQDWMTSRENWNGPISDMTNVNRLFQRLWDDEQLGNETRAIYKRALEREVPLPEMLDILDGLAADIAPGARRDERKWREPYLSCPTWAGRSDFTDFDGEIRYLRQWIQERWAFLVPQL